MELKILFHRCRIDLNFTFAGITSGRGYAHGEVGIAYIDIESVCIRGLASFAFICWRCFVLFVLYLFHLCVCARFFLYSSQR